MSTGKRLAKRSIVGSKVVVQGDDGLYYPAVIQAVRTGELGTRYAVRRYGGNGGSGGVSEYGECDLIGPGFQSSSALTLKAGQRVYVTFTGREIAGQVTCHRPDVDQVHITLLAPNSNTAEIVKRMEEVRLMESRKSLRLMDRGDSVAPTGDATATAASTQASTPSTPAADKHNANGIDVPGAYSRSRKRRSSPSIGDVLMDEEEDLNLDLMDECAAAMVLMRLSCSPHSPRWEELAAWQSNVSSSSSSGAFSWAGSASGDSPPHASCSGSTIRIPTSGRKLKFRSGTPSPPLIGSAPASFSGSVTKYRHPSAAATDDGIASDESISESDEPLSTTSQAASGIIYQCTWPGCSLTTSSCAAIESHVRTLHLGPRQDDEELSDHEEEFYYTEIEDGESDDLLEMKMSHAEAQMVPADGGSEIKASLADDCHSYASCQAGSDPNAGLMTSSPPTLSHMDMARPPHEDPEYQRSLLKAARPISIPSRVRSISWSSGYGYGSLQQKPGKVVGSSNTKGLTSTLSVKSSPVRRPRGEAKKCRKVYGMEHREQWCTQCKWKKACTRFGD